MRTDEQCGANKEQCDHLGASTGWNGNGTPPSGSSGGGNSGGNGGGGGGGGNDNNDANSTPAFISTTVPSIPYSPPCVGVPINEGNLISGYCNGGGIQGQYSTNGQNIEAVSITYSANSDVLLYENAMVIILQEQYLLPPSSVPLGESSTFGYSNLEATLTSGAIAETPLGNFTSSNNQAQTRYTKITYYGKQNFPTQLAVVITFGGDSVGATTVIYNLPFGSQVVTNE
jgi:hypothetical protein